MKWTIISVLDPSGLRLYTSIQPNLFLGKRAWKRPRLEIQWLQKLGLDIPTLMSLTTARKHNNITTRNLYPPLISIIMIDWLISHSLLVFGLNTNNNTRFHIDFIEIIVNYRSYWNWQLQGKGIFTKTLCISRINTE